MVFSETPKISRYKGFPTLQKRIKKPSSRQWTVANAQITFLQKNWWLDKSRRWGPLPSTNQTEAYKKSKKFKFMAFPYSTRVRGIHFMTSGLDLRSPMVNTLLLIKFETIQIIHQNYSGCMLVMPLRCWNIHLPHVECLSSENDERFLLFDSFCSCARSLRCWVIRVQLVGELLQVLINTIETLWIYVLLSLFRRRGPMKTKKPWRITCLSSNCRSASIATTPSYR